MNKLNIDFLRTNYASEFIYFIEQNIQVYVERTIEVSPISKEEILELLNKNIEEQFKIVLLGHISGSITIYNDNYSDAVKEYILINNFDYNDIKELANNYEAYGFKIKPLILQQCKTYIENIITDEITLSNELFDLLINDENIHKEYKISLLANNLKEISKRDYKEYIMIIDYKEYLKIFNKSGKVPSVEINNYNKRLLDALKKKQWIFNYKQEENMYKITRITKSRQPENL